MRISLSVLAVAFLALTLRLFAAEPAPTNSIGIYLFVDGEDWREARNDWKTRPLAAKPILPGEDILSYSLPDHALTLSKAGAERLNEARGAFVMVADGERIYLGTIVSLFSSIPVPLPSILPRLPGQKGSDTIQILRTYHTVAPQDDPRADPRILQVLKTLGKLK